MLAAANFCVLFDVSPPKPNEKWSGVTKFKIQQSCIRENSKMSAYTVLQKCGDDTHPQVLSSKAHNMVVLLAAFLQPQRSKQTMPALPIKIHHYVPWKFWFKARREVYSSFDGTKNMLRTFWTGNVNYMYPVLQVNRTLHLMPTKQHWNNNTHAVRDLSNPGTAK